MVDFNPYDSGSKHVPFEVDKGSLRSPSVELDFSGLLSRVLSVYIAHSKFLMLSVIVFSFFTCVVYFAAGLFVYLEVAGLIPAFANLKDLDGKFFDLLMQEMMGKGALVFVVILALVFFISISQVLLQMVSVFEVGNSELGHSVQLSESLGGIISNIPVYFILSILYSLMIVVGMLLCVFPGLALIVYSMMLLPQLLIGKQSFNSLPESFYILRNRFWKTTGVFIVLYLLYMTVNLVVTIPLSLLSNQVLESFSSSIQEPDAQLGVLIQGMLSNPLLYLSYVASIFISAFWMSLSAVASSVLYANFKNVDDQRLGRANIEPPPFETRDPSPYS